MSPLIPIALGLGLGALFRATQKKRVPTTTPKPGGRQARGSRGTSLDLSAVPQAAAALALAGAEWEASNQLTGSKYGGPVFFGAGAAGAVMGGSQFTTGAGAVVGATVGREVAKALGGTKDFGKEAGSDTLTIGGAIVGFTAAFSAALAVGFSQFVLVFYAVVSIVDDALRLAYGKNGAWTDAMKEFERLYALNQTQLLQLYNTADPDSPVDPLQLKAAAWHMSMGMVREQNRTNLRMWRARAWGLGQSEQGHMKWGYDRGYYIGFDPAQIGNIKDIDALSDGVFNAIRFDVSQFQPTTNTPAPPPGCPQVIGTTWGDVQRQAERFKNLMHYVEWMNTPAGIGISPSGHLNAGIHDGRIYGAPNGGNEDVFTDKNGQQQAGGRLEMDGAVYYWRDLMLP